MGAVEILDKAYVNPESITWDVDGSPNAVASEKMTDGRVPSVERTSHSSDYPVKSERPSALYEPDSTAQLAQSPGNNDDNADGSGLGRRSARDPIHGVRKPHPLDERQPVFLRATEGSPAIDSSVFNFHPWGCAPEPELEWLSKTKKRARSIVHTLAEVEETTWTMVADYWRELDKARRIGRNEQIIARYFQMLDKQYGSDRLRGVSNHNSPAITGKCLPMIIKGREINARHDTGAESGNYIANHLAEELKLKVRTAKSDRKFFKMGDGKVVQAVGRVKALCAFAKESQTKVKCWFHVFRELASPLIFGSDFLRKTKTMSNFKHRLEYLPPDAEVIPKVNLIGSTQQAKRRLAAYIDNRYTYINADSGSHLDLMSSTYVRLHRYHIDRRRMCRKRIELADSTVTETIGQVSATLTMEDGSSYPKTFDVLPGLASDVLLGETTLDEINAFSVHESSFVDVFAGERHPELSVLISLGPVNKFLAHNIRFRSVKPSQTSLAKQQDDAMLEALYAKDCETRPNQHEPTSSPAAATHATVNQSPEEVNDNTVPGTDTPNEPP